MAKGHLFQYAVLFHPRQTKDQRDAGEFPKSELVTNLTTVIAENADQVGMLAARSLPDKFVNTLDCVEIIVRPF